MHLEASGIDGTMPEQQEKTRKAHPARFFVLGLDRSQKQSVSDLGTAHIDKQCNHPQTPKAALRWTTEQLEAQEGATAEPTPSEPGNLQEHILMFAVEMWALMCPHHIQIELLQHTRSVSTPCSHPTM